MSPRLIRPFLAAVAVSESDPNVIFVGGGEKTVRGNVSNGDGMWKSLDARKTWKHVVLAHSHYERLASAERSCNLG